MRRVSRGLQQWCAGRADIGSSTNRGASEAGSKSGGSCESIAIGGCCRAITIGGCKASGFSGRIRGAIAFCRRFAVSRR